VALTWAESYLGKVRASIGDTDTILFADTADTHLEAPGVKLRRISLIDRLRMFRHRAEPVGDWGLAMGSRVVATGGLLFHYNPPYGDIYMEIAEPFRNRGLGAYLVQELKREAYNLGAIPAARCNPNNLASRRTLQKAGFVPYAHILDGVIP